MRKAIIALVAMATMAVASVGDAQAQRRHGGNSGAAAGALIGGLAVGALLGAAVATSRPAYAGYGVAPGYAHYPGYYEPAPIDCPDGYWARRPRFDAYGNLVGYSRPRFFCP